MSRALDHPYGRKRPRIGIVPAPPGDVPARGWAVQNGCRGDGQPVRRFGLGLLCAVQYAAGGGGVGSVGSLSGPLPGGREVVAYAPLARRPSRSLAPGNCRLSAQSVLRPVICFQPES
mgnify:CR=1 FL=1